MWHNYNSYLHIHTYFYMFRIDDEEAGKKLMTAMEIERKNARTIDLLKAKDNSIQKVYKQP